MLPAETPLHRHARGLEAPVHEIGVDGSRVVAPAPPSAPPLPPRAPVAPPPAPAVAPAPGPSRLLPLLVLDPRAPFLPIVRALRTREIPITTLSARRLEPVLFVHGTRRCQLPPISERPERWHARLLELAGTLEERPIVVPGSAAALQLVREARRRVEPHFVLAHLADLAPQPHAPGPDAALRRTLARGEAGLEVQIVRDARGRRTAGSVLAWAPTAAPDVLVSSVAGAEALHRSDDWLAARAHVGYARLLWSPDRFGRLALQAASALPGPGLPLAIGDGVDLAAALYAALCGEPVPIASPPRYALVRRLPCLDPEAVEAELPLVASPVPFSWRDPLPSVAAWARALVRP
jgi:hypothetical protein